MPRPPDEQRVRRMFDGLVPRYALVNDVLSMGLDRWWRRAVVSALDLRPSDRVLDLGCGTGVLTSAVAARSAIVVGVDVSAAMLGRARQRPRGPAGAAVGPGARLGAPLRGRALTAVGHPVGL